MLNRLWIQLDLVVERSTSLSCRNTPEACVQYAFVVLLLSAELLACVGGLANIVSGSPRDMGVQNTHKIGRKTMKLEKNNGKTTHSVLQ